MTQIEKAKVAILATNGFEQSELTSPKRALANAGADVRVIAPKGPSIRGWTDGNWGDSIDVDIELADADDQQFDALILPGGVMNPDQLRIDEQALAFVRKFVESGRIVAAICHGPWILINADAANSRTMTSYATVRRDLENAGANWKDKSVVVDKGIITSRSPDDLEDFNAKIIEEINEGRHSRAA